MADGGISTNSRAEAKDLLLDDYRYLSESFWKSEQAGETRVNIFIGIATAVIGGLVTLSTQEHGISGEPLRLLVVAGLIALLVLGAVTLIRLLKRNKTTDEYKRGLDAVRQTFKDYLDPEGVLAGYYPIASAKPKKGDQSRGEAVKNIRGLRGFGGLAHSVAAINSLVLGGIVAATAYRVCENADSCIENPGQVAGLVLTTTLLAFAVQFAYVGRREKAAKSELQEGGYTHAFGLVYRVENGTVQYLLVRPKERGDEWVLPKGHIEESEGHGEAARREVREEAGVRARLIACVGEVEYETGKEHVKGKGYLLELIAAGSSSESREISWLTLEEAMRESSFEESKYLLAAAERKRIALAAVRLEKTTIPLALGSEFHTDEGCWIAEIHNREDDVTCSIAHARVESGVTTRLHSLRGTIERYVILEGQGKVEIGGGPPTAVAPLDVVHIPAGVPQKITNTGKGDLIFLCVCTPRFSRECYEALERAVK